MGRRPEFVVCGVQRAGTTTLHHWLDAHPQAFVPPGKELRFFSGDGSIEWYETQFAAAGSRVAGEVSPQYLDDGIERLVETLPEARLVVALRHPVERAWSHYWMRRERGLETGGLEGAETVLAGSEYDRLLGRLFELVAMDRVLVVLHDDLTGNPATVATALYRHIGVDDGFRPDLRLVANRYVRVRSVRVRNATTRLPGPLRRVVRRANVRRGAYPPLPTELRAALLERYEPAVAYAERLLGRNLATWRV